MDVSFSYLFVETDEALKLNVARLLFQFLKLLIQKVSSVLLLDERGTENEVLI